MNVPMTLGERWQDHYLIAITMVHLLRHHDVAVVPKEQPTLEQLTTILRDIATNRYQPSVYFKPGPKPQLSLISKAPELSSGKNYTLIGLNALTARGEFVSVANGGVVFEDPFWAILGAHAVGSSTSPTVGIPRAKDNNDLWRRTLVVKEVQPSSYQPQSFFGPIKGLIPPATSPNFELLSVDYDQIAALRSRGMQSLRVSDSLRFFELFDNTGILDEPV